MQTNPIGAEIDGRRIVYSIHLGEKFGVNALYAVAACGPFVLSSHRHIVVFGAVNLAALAFLLWIDSNAKTSLWCAWAAVTSGAIVDHLRVGHRFPVPGSTLPHQLA